jgi:hypothetical protein
MSKLKTLEKKKWASELSRVLANRNKNEGNEKLKAQGIVYL